MQNKSVFLIVFGLFLSAFQSENVNAEHNADLKRLPSIDAGLSSSSLTTKTNIIVATDEWPPFRIASGTKEFKGFDIDLLQAISDITDLTFDVRRYPWSRALKQMQQHKVDMMTGLAYTNKRALYINYIPFPYFTCKPAFYMKKSLDKDILTYEDLYEYEIGYVLNSVYFEPFNSDTKIRRHSVSTEAQLIKMVKRGRLDIFIGTDCQVDYEMTKKGLWDTFIKASYLPSKNIELYLGVTIDKDTSLALKLSNALSKLLKSGKLDEIKNKYFFSNKTQERIMNSY